MRKSLAFAAVFGCVVCPTLTLSGRTPKKPDPEAARFHQKLDKDQQIVHALDRLTFGPKAGDIEAVKKIGIKKWIDLQLHPSRIRESAELLAKLEPLETLRMSQAETVAKYPQARPALAAAALRPIEDLLSRDEIRTLRNGTA